MGLFGGDSDNSSKVKVNTETRQVDRRVGATDNALVATEGSSIETSVRNSTRNDIRKTTNVKVNSVDAKVIRAALAGSSANLSEALAFSSRAAEREARTVEAALANAGGELTGLSTLVKGGVTIAIALGAVFLLARG